VVRLQVFVAPALLQSSHSSPRRNSFAGCVVDRDLCVHMVLALNVVWGKAAGKGARKRARSQKQHIEADIRY